MSEKTWKPNTVSSEPVATITTASFDAIPFRKHIVQDFLIIWLDPSIDQSNKDYQNNLLQMRNVVNEVDIFTQSDECIDYLTDIDDMKIILIIEDKLGQQILRFIYDIPQIDSVYILCNTKSDQKQSGEI